MKTLKAGTVKRIHVDRHVLAWNRKHGANAPAYTIQTSKGSIKTKIIVVHGTLVFDQTMRQLSCGARMYGITHAKVEYAD